MTTRRLLICCVVLVALAVGIQVDAQAKVHAPPTAVCDSDSANELHIVDGVWFQCVCERLPFTGDLCEWYELTTPAHDPHHAPAKKIHKHRRLVPVLVVRFAA